MLTSPWLCICQVRVVIQFYVGLISSSQLFAKMLGTSNILQQSLLAFCLTFFAYLLTFCLTFFLAYLLTFFLTKFLASLLTVFLAHLLTFFPAFFLAYLPTFFLTSLLTLFLASLLTFFLASPLLTSFLDRSLMGSIHETGRKSRVFL